MKFSLIICTYQRPEALMRLLESVQLQSKYPDQILVVDGSPNDHTEIVLKEISLKNLEYFRVEEHQRGLTKQRNFGVERVEEKTEVIFFLDDDTVLGENYFKEILSTYSRFPEAIGVSGYITNETDWKRLSRRQKPPPEKFVYDGWYRTEGSRFRLRRKFGLAPDVPPGMMPDFSHGYSTGFLPPSGKTYEVEMLMGGIASYRKVIFKNLNFEPYFEGYGLYEDADFSLRAARKGKLFVNTAAGVEHHHAAEGRPNMYNYGKMVVRNGWYVWRVKNPNPSLKAWVKWNATSFLLTFVRLSNSINTDTKKDALFEGIGRLIGWWSLLLQKPKSFSKRRRP